ncbi:MAG: GNAT family N-acetyltransferase [Planctomycetaceae bacterium]|nr:GNAT family N-acetyltransferase [Planctomycetaceae bacterium]
MMEDKLITFRPAQAEDVELWFSWANDPVTRAASFRSDPIKYEDHVVWFQESLARPERHLLLAMASGQAVAVLRFDREDDKSLAVISINVAPQARGSGIGTATLHAATAEASRIGVSKIVALIRPDNLASLRTFERAGYLKVGEEFVSGQPAMRYERVEAERF